MYRNDQEPNQNGFSSGGAETHLTKEEMRQKIRASLHAKENAEYGTHTPVYAGRAAQPNSRKNPGNAAPAERARMEKARQVRESMASQRNSAAVAAPVREHPAPAHPTPRSQSPRQDYGFSTSSTKTRKRGGSGAAKVGIITGMILIAILLIFYIGGLAMYHGKFLPNTYVNSVDISGMTAEEAENAVIDSSQEMGVTFIPKEGDSIVFRGSSFGCQVTLPDGALEEAANEGHGTWFTKLFSKSEYTVSLNETYSEDDLVSLIAAYDWGNVPPTDAKIVENEDGTFAIQAEDNGNMVDTTVLSEYTVAQLRSGNNTIDMTAANCYKTADVTSEDLESTLALYNQIGSIEITYDMTNREELFDPAGTEVLGHEEIVQWLQPGDGDTISIDTDKATEWVQTNIADKYDTFKSDGYTRTFESSADGTVELTLTATSTYGWKTDVEATVEKLKEYIQAGESATVEPEYEQAGFRPTTSSGKVFGEKTYIEIDICHQHLWFYVDGELYLESDVVTGLDSDPDRQTHPGVFKIRDRIRDAVLGTYEVQGYSCPVSYWMPIDHTGIGLHDLSRSAYGGEIYKTNGSHGCINLPLDIAGQIFEETVVGMPVIIIP